MTYSKYRFPGATSRNTEWESGVWGHQESTFPACSQGDSSSRPLLYMGPPVLPALSFLLCVDKGSGEKRAASLIHTQGVGKVI